MNIPSPKIVHVDEPDTRLTVFSRAVRSAWAQGMPGTLPHLARILFEMEADEGRRPVDFVRFKQSLGDRTCIVSVDGGNQWRIESALKPHIPSGMIVELEWSP